MQKDSGRSAVCGKQRRRSEDDDKNEDEITEILPSSMSSKYAKPSSSSLVGTQRPTFAFHLLKPSGLSCEVEAQIIIEDAVACGGNLCMVFTFHLEIEWLLSNLPSLYTFHKLIIVHGVSAEDQSQWQEHLLKQGQNIG